MRMKLLLLLATTLLFYTQATEEKKCKFKEYVITDTMASYSDTQTACKNMEGEMASEDLKDSDNAKKAELVFKTFRQNFGYSPIWLGITVVDINQPADVNTNKFAFSDGTDPSSDLSFVPWSKGEPDYGSNGAFRCAMIDTSGKMVASLCSKDALGLCKTYECEDEANSESERSRANLPVFALFMACSVFKTFYALVGFNF